MKYLWKKELEHFIFSCQISCYKPILVKVIPVFISLRLFLSSFLSASDLKLHIKKQTNKWTSFPRKYLLHTGEKKITIKHQILCKLTLLKRGLKKLLLLLLHHPLLLINMFYLLEELGNRLTSQDNLLAGASTTISLLQPCQTGKYA